ncbi:Mn2 and Fe2 transporter of the NRAMP family-like protein [Natrinema versiforme JCM 10478]|uniref:Mn2 and Fe2 transporter of the NRAMP family-like protein n=1 Tax=Natrinema versiforme JCM 10478 TaxID=1227496 RepID=L9XYY5_9EURY|nr:Mn2 and Fe2 transporter of the NRAMP family-like protein [Natrinema versiforme JCM 10478]
MASVTTIGTTERPAETASRRDRPQSVIATADEEAAEGPEPTLEYPERDSRGLFKERFGPSMLWALISIGGSHIVLAPTLGGSFGLVAIWMFGHIYVAKDGRGNSASGTTTASARTRSRPPISFPAPRTGRCR